MLFAKNLWVNDPNMSLVKLLALVFFLWEYQSKKREKRGKK